MEFGTYIKNIREQQGITQKELAKQIGATQQLIARYESGKVEPRIIYALKIFKALKIDPEVILYDLFNDITGIGESEDEHLSNIAKVWNTNLSPLFSVKYKEGYFILTARKPLKTSTTFKHLTKDENIIEVKVGEVLKLKPEYFIEWIYETGKDIDDLLQKQRNDAFKNALKTAWLSERGVISLLQNAFPNDKLTQEEVEKLKNKLLLPTSGVFMRLSKDFYNHNEEK